VGSDLYNSERYDSRLPAPSPGQGWDREQSAWQERALRLGAGKVCELDT